MYERILVPLDGSAAGESVLTHVQWLARKAGSEVLLSQVIEPDPRDVGPGFQEDSRDFADDYLGTLAQALKRAGLRTGIRIRQGPVVETLVTLAREEGASLIAMTTHGRTASPTVPFGGVAERLIRETPVPLLARPSLAYAAEAEKREIRTILVAGDGSAAARAVDPHAADLAALAGATVVLMTAAPQPPDWLDVWTMYYASRGLRTRARVEPGAPAEAILEAAASSGADLIALGTRRAAGGVSRELLRHSPLPLLVA
jgi:nucleotide-binding universal stress UspA family protein